MERHANAADPGLKLIAEVHEALRVGDAWVVTEERGYTWWPSQVRQRIHAGAPTERPGRPVRCQMRAAVAAFRDVPDDVEAYRLVGELNGNAALSAWTYDPESGRVAFECGVVVSDGRASPLGDLFFVASAIQAGMAHRALAVHGDTPPRDREPHPVRGPRSDPAPSLESALRLPDVVHPFTDVFLAAAAEALTDAGMDARLEADGAMLKVIVPGPDDGSAMLALRRSTRDDIGPGLDVGLFLPERYGPDRAAWIANAMNRAEVADWDGSDHAPAVGAWVPRESRIAHIACFPAMLLQADSADESQHLLERFILWAKDRHEAARARLPWLVAAAMARYPDEVIPDEAEEDAEEEADDKSEWNPGPALRAAGFGPGARVGREHPPVPKPHQARTLIVDASDPAAFQEIDDAVSAAEAGDRVLVRPGTYRRCVVVDRAVTIEADGPAGSVILEPVGGEALGIEAAGTRVVGLTIRPAFAGNDGRSWSAIAVHDSAATIERCDLSSHLGATAWIGGPAARVTFQDCTFHDGAQNPIWVVKGAHVTVIGCTARAHRGALQAGGRGTTVLIEDCLVDAAHDVGIGATDGAHLTVQRTRVTGSVGAAIALLGAAPSSLVEGCTVEGSAAGGIVIAHMGGCTIRDNTVTGNRAGIVVEHGARPIIEGNRVDANRLGIIVSGPLTDPEVRDNDVTNSLGNGMLIDEGALGRVVGNRIHGSNGNGIWLDNPGTRPRIAGNTVTGNRMAALLITNNAGAVVTDNDLRGNRAGSWHIAEADSLEPSGNQEDPLPDPEHLSLGAHPASAEGSAAAGRRRRWRN